MSKKLRVGNFTPDTTEDYLAQLFSAYGEVVSAQIIYDRETGHFMGFGFVGMREELDAEQAVFALNGAEFRGRALAVTEAGSREDGSGG